MMQCSKFLFHITIIKTVRKPQHIHYLLEFLPKLICNWRSINYLNTNAAWSPPSITHLLHFYKFNNCITVLDTNYIFLYITYIDLNHCTLSTSPIISAILPPTPLSCILLVSCPYIFIALFILNQHISISHC